MPAYPCNPGLFHWSGPVPGSFRPYGTLRKERMDGARFAGTAFDVDPAVEPMLSARLIVGFNVGAEPTWTLDDLVPVVRAARVAQAPSDPSATFLLQRGIYQHRDRAKGIVEEDGAQVIIFNTTGADLDTFREQMVALAEEIARQLQQELVIVEIQANGVTQRLIGVEP